MPNERKIAVGELSLQRFRRVDEISSRYRVASGSMEPTLHVGDEIEVRPIRKENRPRFGDMLVYLSDDGDMVVHRILWVQYLHTGLQFRECGDANWFGSRVSEDRVLGTVNAVFDEHSAFQTDGCFSRIASILSALLVGMSILVTRVLPVSRPVATRLRTGLLRLGRAALQRFCRVPLM